MGGVNSGGARLVETEREALPLFFLFPFPHPHSTSLKTMHALHTGRAAVSSRPAAAPRTGW